MQRTHVNNAQTLRPAHSRISHHAMRTSRHDAQRLDTLAWCFLEITKNIFNQNNGRVDDDAEIYRAQRQQVGRLPHEHQNHDAEKKCKWNVDADNHRAAQVT